MPVVIAPNTRFRERWFGSDRVPDDALSSPFPPGNGPLGGPCCMGPLSHDQSSTGWICERVVVVADGNEACILKFAKRLAGIGGAHRPKQVRSLLALALSHADLCNAKSLPKDDAKMESDVSTLTSASWVSTGIAPHWESSNRGLSAPVEEGIPMRLPGMTDDTVWELLEKCWSIGTPRERPPIIDIWVHDGRYSTSMRVVILGLPVFGIG
ncbi:hypothetical protein BJ322DRAFT_1020983 [Thelephora terrestris]|uniref:Uncharacterized protein n=1 Tax=Thelephora terrestris TaxID=56493 RepID=A0A9P6L7D2_9AGAM|nr:hypothetical protein BJ322DRAFT_1020983 [Thelephora terrestris]